MAKLRDKAILVHCRICQWSGSKRSQKESEELCNKKGAAEDAATVIINFVPKESLADLRKKGSKIRSTFFKWSRPWLDGGIRILALSKMNKYDESMQQAIAEYNKCASQWVNEQYPTLLQKMPDRLAKLLPEQPMPTQLELLRKFQIQHSKFPVPDADDILVGGEGSETLKQEVSRSIAESTKRTMVDIWSEMAKLIQDVQDRLSDPDKKFKNSLIKNLQAFCERITDENYADDQKLEELRQTVLKKLASIDPQDLRENKLFRKGTSLKAGAVLETIRQIDLDLE